MQIKIEEIPTPKPPRQVTLVLSEGEAALIREFASYYDAHIACDAAAARLSVLLKNAKLELSPYPYKDCFNGSKS